MVKKVEMFTTDSGKSFLSEETAHHQEAVDRLIAILPQLKMVRSAVEGSIAQIATAMIPLAGYLTKTTPEVEPETTLRPAATFKPSSVSRWGYCGTREPDQEQSPREAAVVVMRQMAQSNDYLKEKVKNWLLDNGWTTIVNFRYQATEEDVKAFEQWAAKIESCACPTMIGGDKMHDVDRCPLYAKPVTKGNARWGHTWATNYIERLWLDGKVCNPYTGEPCPYDHPKGSLCSNCEDWRYGAAPVAEVIEKQMDGAPLEPEDPPYDGMSAPMPETPMPDHP